MPYSEKQIAEWAEELEDALTAAKGINSKEIIKSAAADLIIAVTADLIAAVRKETREECARVEKCRTFTMYRENVPTDTHDENQRNAPDEPQFEGIVFSDGRVAVRWLTAKRSTSTWDSLEDMLAIHGHPEYGSKLVWHDAAAIRNLQEREG